MKKQTTIIVIGIVLIIVAFFGGKAYGKSHATTATGAGAYTGFTRGAGGAGGFAGRAGGAAGGATIGQVVSEDATSITVSLAAGGSKIILYTPTTTISKTAAGTISDVTVGSNISATGTANSDGSMTATAIQIRPAGNAITNANPGGPMIPATTTQ